MQATVYRTHFDANVVEVSGKHDDGECQQIGTVGRGEQSLAAKNTMKLMEVWCIMRLKLFLIRFACSHEVFWDKLHNFDWYKI